MYRSIKLYRSSYFTTWCIQTMIHSVLGWHVCKIQLKRVIKDTLPPKRYEWENSMLVETCDDEGCETTTFLIDVVLFTLLVLMADLAACLFSRTGAIVPTVLGNRFYGHWELNHVQQARNENSVSCRTRQGKPYNYVCRNNWSSEL
jgi:hypothetical protein